LMPYDQSLSKVRMVLKGTCLDFWTWYNGMTSFNFQGNFVTRLY